MIQTKINGDDFIPTRIVGSVWCAGVGSKFTLFIYLRIATENAKMLY